MIHRADSVETFNPMVSAIHIEGEYVAQNAQGAARSKPLRVGLFLATRFDRGYLHAFPPLGLGYIKASLAHHLPGVEILLPETLEELLQYKPDIVGISTQTESYMVAIETAKKIKQGLNVPVVVGGVHMTMMPFSLDPVFDLGVVGEGEFTFVEIVRLFLEKGRFEPDDLAKMSGIVYWKNGSPEVTPRREIAGNLDSLPAPQIENLPFFNKTSGMVCLVSARGCPYHCTFCISEKNAQRYRSLSVDRIVQDVTYWIKEKKIKHIVFYDDLLIASKKKVEGLIAGLKATGVFGQCTFSCAVRANLIDREMCALLKELGVIDLGMGVESFCDKTLKFYNKTGCSGEINQRAIDLLSEAGIKVNPSIIFGAPSETREDMLITLRKVFENLKAGKIVGPTWATLIPYPGTAIWDYAEKRGLVSRGMDWDKFTRCSADLYLCENVSKAEFGVLIEEWLLKNSLLLLHKPEAGGSFVKRDPDWILRKALEVYRVAEKRGFSELGDDLVASFVKARIGLNRARLDQANFKAAAGRPADLEKALYAASNLEPWQEEVWEKRIEHAPLQGSFYLSLLAEAKNKYKLPVVIS